MAEQTASSSQSPASWRYAKSGSKRRNEPWTDSPPTKRKYGYGSTGVLPTMSDSSDPLDIISASTVLEALDGQHSDRLDSCLVIDCRPRSHFHKGHIKGALNVTSWHELDLLMSAEIESDDRDPERHAYIFLSQQGHAHDAQCLRYVRDTDRELNQDEFPFLYFPNLYVLQGGYEAYVTARRHAARCSRGAGEDSAKESILQQEQLAQESLRMQSELINQENRCE